MPRWWAPSTAVTKPPSPPRWEPSSTRCARPGRRWPTTPSLHPTWSYPLPTPPSQKPSPCSPTPAMQSALTTAEVHAMSTARNIPPDRGLSIRMFTTGLMIVILYAVVIGLLIAFGLSWSVVLIFAGAILFVQYWFSDKIALFGMGGRLVTPEQAPQLHGVIDRLCAMADMKKPRVAIADTDVPNAFATGRSPNSAVVCATTGLMRRLDDSELEAVLSHELSHVAHRDVAVMTIASFLGMMAGLVTRMMLWTGLIGGFGGQFAIARQRHGQQEADGVDDDRDDQHAQFDEGGLIARIVVAAPAAAESPDQPGPQHHPGDQAGHHPEEAGDGHDGDVAMGHMGQLVGEHRFELGVVKAAHQAGGGTHHRAVRAASGGKRIRDVGVGDCHPGFLHVRHGAQPVDDAVELGCLLRGDQSPAHPEQGDLVGEPVLHEEDGAGEDQNQGPRQTERDEQPDDDRVEDHDHQPGGEHPDAQAPVRGNVACCGHGVDLSGRPARLRRRSRRAGTWFLRGWRRQRARPGRTERRRRRPASARRGAPRR